MDDALEALLDSDSEECSDAALTYLQENLESKVKTASAKGKKKVKGKKAENINMKVLRKLVLKNCILLHIRKEFSF